MASQDSCCLEAAFAHAQDIGPRLRGSGELFLLSFVSLFIELLVIRWMSADIRAFTIFRTFPLVTCFVGLGAGFASSKDSIFRSTPYAILLFAVVMKLAAAFGIKLWAFPSSSVFQWQNLVIGNVPFQHLFIFMLVLVCLLCGPFLMSVCIGARLGVLFTRMPPLRAYCINVAGASRAA